MNDDQKPASGPPPCPDPMADWEGYCLWQEMMACQSCDGEGTYEIDDGDTLDVWICQTCGGTGLDPDVAPDDDDGS